MNKFVIELYITGNSLRSDKAIQSIRKICETMIKEEVKIDIIDVLDNPEKAEQEKVMATPTLIKRIPPPVRRLVGDLSDVEKVMYYLDLK